MSDENLVYKTVPLAIAKHAGGVQLTAAEREALVQAHMARVHPQIDALREQEASVQKQLGDPKERSRLNSRKSKRKQVALARERAAAIAAKRLDAGREVG